jgi:hypothetical protein
MKHFDPSCVEGFKFNCSEGRLRNFITTLGF